MMVIREKISKKTKNFKLQPLNSLILTEDKTLHHRRPFSWNGLLLLNAEIRRIGFFRLKTLKKTLSMQMFQCPMVRRSNETVTIGNNHNER